MRTYWVNVVYDHGNGPWLCAHTSPYKTKKDALKAIEDVDKNCAIASWIQVINESNKRKTKYITSLVCYRDAVGMKDTIVFR